MQNESKKSLETLVKTNPPRKSTSTTLSTRCILIERADPITKLALTPRTQREAGIADCEWKYDTIGEEKLFKYIMFFTGIVIGTMLVTMYV